MTNPTVTAREALELHVAYEALPADRGGKNGPKGRAWSAFIEARDAALSALDAGPVGVGVIGRDALVDAAADHPRLGQQLVSNRGFAVSTGWTLGANFTITGGVLRSSAGSVAKGWGDTHDPNARPLYTKETILSALSLSEPTPAGWRPMETAPRDGSRFLSFVEGQPVDFFRWQSTGPHIGWRDGFITVYPEDNPNGPKLWVPIPTTPEPRT